jgi:hypothetical protein
MSRTDHEFRDHVKLCHQVTRSRLELSHEGEAQDDPTRGSVIRIRLHMRIGLVICKGPSPTTRLYFPCLTPFVADSMEGPSGRVGC